MFTKKTLPECSSQLYWAQQNEAQMQCAERKKPDTNEIILYYFKYIKSKNRQNKTVVKKKRRRRILGKREGRLRMNTSELFGVLASYICGASSICGYGGVDTEKLTKLNTEGLDILVY